MTWGSIHIVCIIVLVCIVGSFREGLREMKAMRSEKHRLEEIQVDEVAIDAHRFHNPFHVYRGPVRGHVHCYGKNAPAPRSGNSIARQIHFCGRGALVSCNVVAMEVQLSEFTGLV